MSEALDVMRILGRAANSGGPGKDRWMQRWHRALETVILSGLQWDEGDFKAAVGNGGQLYADIGERYYSMALGLYGSRDKENISAARSIEAWMGRRPWLERGQRVGVGSKVVLDGVEWNVSSFSEGDTHINLRSRSINAPTRLRISREDWDAREAAYKAEVKARRAERRQGGSR